jgi:hypothetical protein
MITRKMVFVLGAGAHQPHGFPTGAELIANILSTIPPNFRALPDFWKLSNGIYANLADVPPEVMLQFRSALDHGGHTSIHSFLATHAKRSGFTVIGKLAVANELIPLEFKHEWTRDNRKGDWMSLLFESMLHGCLGSVDEFIPNNTVSFVIFIYDRTLENFLCTRLSHTYNLRREESWEHAQRLRIVHVYGSLGDFDPSTRILVWDRARIAEAASSIRLMYDDRGEHSEVAAAIELIVSVDWLCFLGFGFDPDNITRLKLNQVCASAASRGFLFATRFGTRKGDWSRVQQNMGSCRLNPANEYFETNSIDWDCLEFLHQTSALG